MESPELQEAKRIVLAIVLGSHPDGVSEEALDAYLARFHEAKIFCAGGEVLAKGLAVVKVVGENMDDWLWRLATPEENAKIRSVDGKISPEALDA